MTNYTRAEVEGILARIAKIEADLDNFDGDQRGHYAALDDAHETLGAAAPDLARQLLAMIEGATA